MNPVMEAQHPDITVRRARPGDGGAIATIRAAGWRSGYRGIVPDHVLAETTPDPEHRENMLRQRGPGVVHLIAETRGHHAGWLCFGPSRDTAAGMPDDVTTQTATVEIYACYVHPQHWRRGVGQALVATCLTHIGDGVAVILWVLKANRAARRFYAAMGFAPDGHEHELVWGDSRVPEVRYRRPAAGSPRQRRSPPGAP